MKRVFGVALFTLAIAATWTLSMARAEEKEGDKPKFTIKDAMKEHGKGKIKDKAIAGTATKEEKDKLVELYEAMSKAEPPKGTKESWKEKTDALVAAAKAVQKGEEGAGKKLDAATKCGACHSVHKKS